MLSVLLWAYLLISPIGESFGVSMEPPPGAGSEVSTFDDGTPPPPWP